MRYSHPSNLPVVSLGSLLLDLLPLLQLLGVGEGNPVDPLQGLSIRLALPVSGGILRYNYYLIIILVTLIHYIIVNTSYRL